MKQIKQIDIRERNLKNVYEYVLHNTNSSRAKIAKALELSRPSSSSLVDELIAIGALFEDGKTAEKRGVGRTPTLLRTDFQRYFCIALFWKEKRILASVVRMGQDQKAEMRILESQAFPIRSKSNYGLESLKIISILKEKYIKNYHYLGSSVVLPGIVDPVRKSILSHPLGISFDLGKHIISEVLKSQEDSIGFFNDNAILGYAAMQRLDLQDKNFLYINLSTGIGAAYFMKGKIFGDAGGKLTQFGHIIVNPEGNLCSCGSRGCLEAEIGETAIRKIIKSFPISKEKPPLLAGELLQSILDKEEINRPFYRCIKEKFIHDLSLAISNVSTMVFPDLILLGGQFPLWGEEFLEELMGAINKIGFSYIMQDLNLLYSQETEEEIQVTATDYLFSHYFHFTSREIVGIHLG